MDQPLLAAAGIALLAATMIDVLWTTLASSAGKGPLTRLLARAVWLAPPRRHRVLQLTGYVILVGIPLTWILAMWAGWALLFNADEGAVLDAASQTPADTIARIGYAAGAMAGAGASYVAGSGGWQVANNVAALFGLALFTLSISYVVQVVTANAQKRATALHIYGLGSSPAEIVAPGVGKEALGAVGSQITSLASGLALISRHHLALPILHYFHAPDPRASIELAVARLDEAIRIVDHALPEEHPAVTRPARLIVEEFVATAMPRIRSQAPPPAPDLAQVAAAGADLNEHALRSGLEADREHRLELQALVEENAWDWSEVVAGE